MEDKYNHVRDHWDGTPEAHAQRSAQLRATIPADVLEKVKDWKMTSCGVALAPFAGKTWEMDAPVPFAAALDWYANVCYVGIRGGYMTFDCGGELYFESGKFSSMKEAKPVAG